MTGGDHLGDTLSAFVDDELDAVDVASARRHLEGCSDCRAELEATQAMADTVRGLPEVAPRFGFFERLTSRRRGPTSRRSGARVGLAVASVAAIAAVAVGVAGDLGGALVSPPVDDMVEVHQAGFLPSVSAEHGFEQMPDAESDPPAWSPDEVGNGLERAEVYERAADDVVAVVYGSGDESVSVFEQSGRLDTDGLGDGMEATARHLWVTVADGVHALVVDRGRLVYTVIGRGPMASLIAVVADLPDAPPPSLWQRAREAGTDLVWTFGLGD